MTVNVRGMLDRIEPEGIDAASMSQESGCRVTVPDGDDPS